MRVGLHPLAAFSASLQSILTVSFFFRWLNITSQSHNRNEKIHRRPRGRRMQRRFQSVTLVTILGLGLATQSWGQGGAPITAEMAQRIDSVFATWDNTRSPGCALGVSQNGKQVYSRGYGMANLEYDVPVTPGSIFDVASISKQFTALSIALLASDGKLSLDDDVRRYLPELPDYGQKVTIRHLLTHTSGLRDQFNLLSLAGWREDDVITEDDVLNMVLRQTSLNFVPGAEHLYSNTGFTLLAVIVKRVSGQSLREFADTRIFGPLGMRDTHFHDDHTMIVRGRTSAYWPRPGGGWRTLIPVSDDATSLFTTVGDLLKWEQNFVDARVGGRAVLDEMQMPGRLNDGTTTDYGFGLRLGAYRGVRTVGHAGSSGGYKADVVRFPDQHLAIATLCNFGPLRLVLLAAKKVAKIFLGSGGFSLLAPLAPAVSIGEAEVAALAGTYWNPITDDVLRFVMKDGKLMEQGSSDTLVPLGGGRFRVGEQSTEFMFPPAVTGTPQELHASSSATAVFRRVTAPSDSAADLRRYAGEYRSDELDVIYNVVVLPEGRLATSKRKFQPRPLEMVQLDTFSGDGTVTFTRAPSGEVTGFTISTGRVRRLSFTRVGAASSPGK